MSRAVALGAAVGAVAAACYFVASGRPLDYDSSITVGIFVKSGSMVDPLRRQVALEQPSAVLDRRARAVDGRTPERILAPDPADSLRRGDDRDRHRVVRARHWGLLPGLSAGAIVAANPLFAQLSRQLRGYSLLCLCAVASTLLLWRLLEERERPPPSWVRVGYVLLVAAGIATHLYGVVVLVVHVGIVVARVAR